MISKLRFSLIAVLMLVLFGFGLQDQAKGQPGTDLQFCPGVPFTDGWIDTDISPAPGGGFASPDFSAALIGTVETFDGVRRVGGLDWMHQNFFGEIAIAQQVRQNPFEEFIIALIQGLRPTNQVGAQLVTWWTQKDGRNTSVQVTNYDGGPLFDPINNVFFVNVHVRIYDENCVEIRDFCDVYTEGDTHVYDLGDLVGNNGLDQDETILQDREGFLVVTPVDDCPSPDRAIDYNFMAGTTYILDPNDYLYGINMYARAGVCLPDVINLVPNGSFEFSGGSPWFESQGPFIDRQATESDFSPQVPVPPCANPFNPDCAGDQFQALVASDATPLAGIGSGEFYGQFGGTPGSILANNQLIGQGIETNVSVLQSAQFTVSNEDLCDDNPRVSYDIQVFNPSDLQQFVGCDNYTAVCVVNVTNPLAPFFHDCKIYNVTGAGNILQNSTFGPIVSQTFAIGDDGQTYAFGATSLEFQGGKSGIISDSLDVNNNQSYVVQVITGQEAAGVCPTNQFFGDVFGRGTNGAVVDNFTLLCLDGFDCVDIGFGDNVLDGGFNVLLPVTPDAVAGQFNAPTGVAGADVVHINFADQYLPNYEPLAARITADVGIWNDQEQFTSCGTAQVCFIRLGIDAAIVISEDFVGPTLTPTTPTPPTPGTPTPTPGTPTPTQRGGGSSSCAIAGNPIQLGTAMANVLIPLIPVAFAFGVRAVRRRKK